MSPSCLIALLGPAAPVHRRPGLWGDTPLFTGKRGVSCGILVHTLYRLEEFASCSQIPYSFDPEQVLDLVRHVFCAY